MKTTTGELWKKAARQKFLLMILLLCCAVLSSIIALAQGTRGTIKGIVTDSAGAVVPGATVKLIDVAKETMIRTIQTNNEGVYQFIEIEPATYNITITATGFTESKLTAIKVEPNRNLQIDATINVSGANEVVTVTGSQELIDRESATLGTTVDRRRVQDLPLNGRNVLQLAQLQPGVIPVAGGLGIRVNGSRNVENNITLDGANNNEVAVGGATGAQPRPDAVQEFRALTSNFEAEFGRNTGSVINVVVKNGANDFHGNARTFYRPTFLSAARYFDQDSIADRVTRGPTACKRAGGATTGPD
ncbi:MAG: carboxypeptidase regulatory-like domain-containing protein, partial [Blastocatellia bacterium]